MCSTIFLGGGIIIQLKGRKEGQTEHYSPFFLINQQLLTANSEWLTVAEHNQMPRKKQKDKTHWKNTSYSAELTATFFMLTFIAS